MELTDLLEAMLSSGAGDLHLQAGSPPMLRVGGELIGAGEEVLSDDRIRDLMGQISFEEAQIRLDEHRTSDFSFEMPGRARFRVNAFYERGRVSLAFR